MCFEQGLSLDQGIGFELVPRLKILREVVEFWENETIFFQERNDNGTQRQLCVVEGGNQCAVHGSSRCA